MKSIDNDKALYFLMVLLNANNNSLKIPFKDFENLRIRNEPLSVTFQRDHEDNIVLFLHPCECPKHSDTKQKPSEGTLWKFHEFNNRDN